jgi:hypothetical protein
VKKSCVSEWHKRFKKGRENVEHDKRSGRPRYHRIYENVEEVWNVAHSDKRLSIRAIKKVLNFGPTIALFSITMLQLTRRSLSSIYWPANRLLKWNINLLP